MDDNYFDKRMKAILESASDTEPSPAALEDMQQQIRAAKSTGAMNWNRWLPLGLLFLLIPMFWGGTVLFQQNQRLQAEMRHISAQLTERQLVREADQIQTTYFIDTIYRIDTIFKTVYIEEYRHQNNGGVYSQNTTATGLAWPTMSVDFGRTFPGQALWGWDRGGKSLLASDPDSPSLAEEAPGEKGGVPETAPRWGMLNPLPKLAMPNPSLTHPSLAFLLNTSYLEGKKKRRINPLHYFTPTGATIAGHYTPFLFNSTNNAGNQFAAGLEGKVHLPQNRSLSIGAEWTQAHFEIKDPDNVGNYPIVAPDYPTDELHELKGQLSFLQLPIMLRQQFGKNTKWKPHLSAGVVAIKPLQQRFVYEYINGSGEYKRRATFNAGSLGIQQARIGFGVDYHWRKKWRISPEFIYQHEWSTASLPYWSMQYWTVRLGVGYQLK